MKIIPKPVSFDWDKGNVDKNFKKHKITNKETEEAFNDKSLKIFTDLKHSQKERRFVAYGLTNEKRNLTVVFTLRSRKIRIISARTQNKKERSVYEKAKIYTKI